MDCRGNAVVGGAVRRSSLVWDGARSAVAPAGHNSSVFRFSDIEVHQSELHIRRNGDVLPVEPKAFLVLLYLLRNPGRLIPKDELIKCGRKSLPGMMIARAWRRPSLTIFVT